VHFNQRINKQLQRFELSRSEIVFGPAGFRNTANHANANCAGVVAVAMCANLVKRAAIFNSAVAADYKMVTDIAPLFFMNVNPANPFCTDVHRWFSGCAMDDDFVNWPHVADFLFSGDAVLAVFWDSAAFQKVSKKFRIFD
jgi:hypothetical protein